MPPRHHIFAHIKHIHDYLARECNHRFQMQDLTLVQVHALGFLAHQPNQTATLKEVERALNVAQSTTAGVIARLEKKEFITTSVDPQDKRIKHATLTERSRTSMQAVHQKMHETEADVFGCLTDDERETLLDLLQKVSQNLNQRTPHSKENL